MGLQIKSGSVHLLCIPILSNLQLTDSEFEKVKRLVIIINVISKKIGSMMVLQDNL